ncbi:MAG: DNA-binding LytR/AlgR family response regulator [Crocinitomix sp.]|jgi:DNA-binding LytR/AlgR family response regulator
MSKINCIIVEDEFPALEIIKSYLSEIQNWHIAGEFTNAIDAINYLSENTVDVVFLDIQLPKLSGIGFIKSLDKPPLIVITTAYNEHAVEAFELTVFDYLLKPYPFERFYKTINRLNKHFQSSNFTQAENDSIHVRENRENVKIDLNSVRYIESQKEYVSIVCEKKTVKTKLSMSKIESMLGDFDFLRVHRSYLIAIDKVDSYTSKQIRLGESSIPIGRYYQKEVRSRLDLE